MNPATDAAGWEPVFQFAAYEEAEELWRWKVYLGHTAFVSLPKACPVNFRADGHAADLADSRVLARQSAEQILDDYHRWRRTLVVEALEVGEDA